jgi:hypothetical protein
MKRLTGPEPTDPTLINLDFDANLFDHDSMDLTATQKVIKSALARARLEDSAAVTRIEIPAASVHPQAQAELAGCCHHRADDRPCARDLRQGREDRIAGVRRTRRPHHRRSAARSAGDLRFSSDSVARSTISFSLESMGPRRLSVATSWRWTKRSWPRCKANRKQLAGNKTVYLESVSSARILRAQGQRRRDRSPGQGSRAGFRAAARELCRPVAVRASQVLR